MIVGAKCKAILTKAIIDKSFKLSLKSKHRYPSGKITSIMGADLARIDLAIRLYTRIDIFSSHCYYSNSYTYHKYWSLSTCWCCSISSIRGTINILH